jgi:hypothetical protein
MCGPQVDRILIKLHTKYAYADFMCGFLPDHQAISTGLAHGEPRAPML